MILLARTVGVIEGQSPMHGRVLILLFLTLFVPPATFAQLVRLNYSKPGEQPVKDTARRTQCNGS
jgi:hypothetical protein